MIKECHRHIQCIDIRQREVGGRRDNEELKIKNKRRQKPPLIFFMPLLVYTERTSSVH